MGKIDGLKSLIMFNCRVLSMGDITDIEKDDLLSLRNKMLYNSVVINNLQEICAKHDIGAVNSVIQDMVVCATDNIMGIYKILNEDIPDDGIKFSEANKMIERHIIVDEYQNHLDILVDDIYINDVLIQYPYDSFESFVKFIYSLPNANAIELYITLYRIGDDETLFNALKYCCNNGVCVNVNIELGAYGEAINANWVSIMNEHGMNVKTFMDGMVKVHSKLMYVKFKNGDDISFISSGNFHAITTKQYTDIGIFTSNPIVNRYISMIFDMLFRNIPLDDTDTEIVLISIYNMRRTLIRLIDEQSLLGIHGYIAIKINSLDDDEIIESLNDAANNGCVINLIVRGVCTWVPDETLVNVTIKSIIWEKLEHSRIYAFGLQNPKVYVGSADIVKKKLDMRIEVLILVDSPIIRHELLVYLIGYINNVDDSWELVENGKYVYGRRGKDNV